MVARAAGAGLPQAYRRALRTPLELQIDNYPTSEEGLSALVEQPVGASNWNGPYLKKKTIPKDPWGNDYHYRSPGENGMYDLYSLGQDNMEGGEGDAADVVSW